LGGEKKGLGYGSCEKVLVGGVWRIGEDREGITFGRLLILVDCSMMLLFSFAIDYC
jgi:hypothetical protein